MRDQSGNVINYCSSSFDMGRISVCNKIIIRNLKIEKKMEIKDIFT